MSAMARLRDWLEPGLIGVATVGLVLVVWIIVHSNPILVLMLAPAAVASYILAKWRLESEVDA